MQTGGEKKESVDDGVKTRQCVHCNRIISRSAAICPSCGQIQTSAYGMVQQDPQKKDDDVTESGKIEIEKAFRAGILSQSQENVLETILSNADSIGYGQKKVLSSLVIEITHEIDSNGRGEKARLLRHYLNTLSFQDEIANALAQAFELD